MVPRNLENLRQLVRDWNIPSVNSGLIPGHPLFMWGIGVLLLVKIIGAIAADKFPSRNALEKKMIKMLRSFTGPAQFDNHTNLGEALASKERPGCPNVKVISLGETTIHSSALQSILVIRFVLIFDIQLNFFRQVFNKLPPDHVGTDVRGFLSSFR